MDTSPLHPTPVSNDNDRPDQCPPFELELQDAVCPPRSTPPLADRLQSIRDNGFDLGLENDDYDALDEAIALARGYENPEVLAWADGHSACTVMNVAMTEASYGCTIALVAMPPPFNSGNAGTEESAEG